MSKLNLPPSDPDAPGPAITPEVFSVGDVSKEQASMSRDYAGVAKGRLAVQQEALRTIQSALSVAEKAVQLRTTRAEWEGRVETAKQKVEEAKVGLDKAREKTKQVESEGASQTAYIDYLTKSRDALLDVLGDLRDEAKHPDTDTDRRLSLQKQIADLAGELSRLKL